MQKQLGIIFLIIFICIHCTSLFAQQQSKDSSSIKILNPKKATIYSAILPGLGQIYNGKYWKSAIVYAGFGGITASFIYNTRQLKSYQNAVNLRFDTLASTIDIKYPTLTDGTVQSLRNYHRRNRDLCILGYIGLYALNIIDANVDAHLQEFKLNKDLSLRWQPNIEYLPNGNLRSTLSFTLTF